MSRQVPSSALAVSFSTRRTVLPAAMIRQVATLAGVDGLDVDATSALFVVGGAVSGVTR